jgi:hypothetical protein
MKDIVFKKVAIEDKEAIELFLFKYSSFCLSAFTFSSLVAWERVYHYQWAIVNDTLLLKLITIEDHKEHLMQPIGEFQKSLQDKIIQYAQTLDYRLTIYGVSNAFIAKDLSKMVQDVKLGKGTIGALLTDTLFSFKLNQTIKNLNTASDSILVVAGNLKNVSEKIKNGNGAIAVLLNDTALAHNLNSSMYNVKKGTESFSEDMEALKHSWPFKKYFKTIKNK